MSYLIINQLPKLKMNNIKFYVLCPGNKYHNSTVFRYLHGRCNYLPECSEIHIHNHVLSIPVGKPTNR